jgi:hypothetical protein
MILNFYNFPSLRALMSHDDLNAVLTSRVDNLRVGNLEVTGRGWTTEMGGMMKQEISLAVSVNGRPGQVSVDLSAFIQRGQDDSRQFVITDATYTAHRSRPHSGGAIYDGHFVYRDLDNIPTVDLSEAIGDTSCLNNARSPHLRCAINPCGPCEGCPDYESKASGNCSATVALNFIE